MYKLISLAIPIVLLSVWLGFAHGDKAKTEENMPKTKINSGSHPLNTLSNVVVSTDSLSNQEKDIMLEQVISTDKLFPDQRPASISAHSGKTYANAKEKPVKESIVKPVKQKPAKEKKVNKPKDNKGLKKGKVKKDKPVKPEKPAKEEENPVKIPKPSEKPADQTKPKPEPKPEKPMPPEEEDTNKDDGTDGGQSDAQPSQQDNSAQIQSITPQNESTTE
ncbi:hypothetical protein M1K46_19075 [Fictibacillus sp. WQ 8-8]|uniref:hypothetical protein n=1 Tax=Fictibacillus sp. WQ 8-8 TaxID=2938788 RepID=UPI00210CDA76|nr:hypothetical protein [Fictibacillus sp. WQ 8-8]MCQ6267737.1 hypothetical protein [Fictibacillus sp. WQ 8-8]